MKKKFFSKLLTVVLAASMMLTLLPVSAMGWETYDADVDVQSTDTVTQPFESGTAGSTNFRIPALITLSNGWLLAAADARWNDTADGCGLDTIVSLSKDNGSTWDYSLVNYFKDSNGYKTEASAFIDPVLVQGADDEVYLFVDLYPGGGHYIHNIQAGTGFVDVGGESHLALYASTSANSSTSPSYYVANKLNAEGYYNVYYCSDDSAAAYVLDAEYNIYEDKGDSYAPVYGTQLDSSDSVQANVFFTGSANQSGLYVLGTEYIVMRKGTVTDDGIEWGNMQLLNVKNDNEYFYGFGPGGAICTSTGRIIVPLYTYDSDDGYTSVIYSDDNGETWTRSADMNVQTSEASISEVKVDGTQYLYMFTRHGGYFVSSDDGATWSNQKSVGGISYYTGCELSTLTYSAFIDGCPAILLSAPTNDRTNGKIFVGLVQKDGSINWKYTYQVNSGTFQYSDLVELSDDNGSIGLLYESGSAEITFRKIGIRDIVGEEAEIYRITSTTPDVDDAGGSTGSVADANGTGVTVEANGVTSVSVTASEAVTTENEVSKTYSILLNNGGYTSYADVYIPYDEAFDGCTRFYGTVDGTNEQDNDVKVYLNNSRTVFTCQVPHFSDVTIYGVSTTSDSTKTETITLTVDETATEELNEYVASGSDTSSNIANVAWVGTEETNVAPVKEASLSTNDKVIIGNNTQWIKLDGSSIAMTNDAGEATVWTVTGNNYSYTFKSGSYYLRHANNSLSAGSSTNNNSWQYSGSNIYYTTNSILGTTYYYLQYNNNWQVSRSSSRASAYTVPSTTPASSTITFTGVHVGETDVTVGDTIYHIVVTPTSKAIMVRPGSSVTVTENGNVTQAQLSAVTGGVSATMNGSSLTFAAAETAEKKDYGPFLIGDTEYTVTVADRIIVDTSNSPIIGGSGQGDDKVVTKLTISVGATYDLDAKTGYTGGIWASDDTAIATVNSSGVVTGVKEGTTYVTYTVNGVVYAVEVRVVPDYSSGNASAKVCDMYIDNIVDTDVAYSINMSTSMYDVQIGEVIYLKIYPNFAINFFAKAENGYALVYMASTNSDGNYYYLGSDSSESAVTALEAYTEGAIETQRVYNWSNGTPLALLQSAIESGYQGTMGWTRGGTNNGDITSSLTFISSKLPTMEKTITSITHANKTTEDYTDGTMVEIGDTINYTITITKYAQYPTMTDPNDSSKTYGCKVTYSKQKLLDELTSGSTALSGVDLTSVEGTDTRCEVTTSLKLSEDNFATVVKNGVITNTADLSYSYSAEYGTGSMTASASAVAEIRVKTATYVVDFGLPVVIDCSQATANEDINSATVNSGSVTVSGTTITYTPDSALAQSKDGIVVTLSYGKAKGNAITILPASNVLYEESFLKVATDKGTTYADWTSEPNVTNVPTQQTQKVGETDKYVFGYDKEYDESTGNSLGSAWTISNLTSGKGSKYLTTTFYGNGFDLIGTAGPNTGYVYLMIQGDGGNRLKIIDTSYVGGDGDTTLYQVPLAHITGLTEGTYTVYVRATYRAASGTQAASASTYAMGGSTGAADEIYAMLEELYNDGFDIDDIEFIGFDESAASVSTYAANSETGANQYRPAGNTVSIDGFRVYRSTDNASYPTNEQGVEYWNILDVVQGEITAWTESNGENKVAVGEYESNGGPQNEIYLGANQSVTFGIGEANKTIQVSLRAVSGSVQWATSKEGDALSTISSNTEMYYEVTSDANGTVTIANRSTDGALLAIGNVKLKNGTATQTASELPETAVYASVRAAFMAVDAPVVDDPVEDAPSFKPELKVSERVVNLFRSKIVTLTITTSLDVETLEVNGHYLRPTNAWMVKMGWADSYTYVYVDTLSRGETGEYQITAYDIDGNAYADYYKV